MIDDETATAGFRPLAKNETNTVCGVRIWNLMLQIYFYLLIFLAFYRIEIKVCTFGTAHEQFIFKKKIEFYMHFIKLTDRNMTYMSSYF